MQGQLPAEISAFQPPNTAHSAFSPTIGFVLDFIILYRLEADPQRLADPATNRIYRTDEYGILHISSQYENQNEQALAVRRHLTREFKLNGFEVNLIDNDGEFEEPFFERQHPNANNCEDPLHCRWSVERVFTVVPDDEQMLELARGTNSRYRNVQWLALRLVSPAMKARSEASLDKMGRAVRILNGYKTFVSRSCEFNLHYGDGFDGFSTGGLTALAKAIWLIDPIMDTYHPEHRRDIIYRPYSWDQVCRRKNIYGCSSAASRSNLANHMTVADISDMVKENAVYWGQDMWDEDLLEEARAPPCLGAALRELDGCRSTFQVATLMATMPRPSYDFGDYLWCDEAGDYLVGGPQVVLRQHAPTLDGRRVQAWAAFWAAFFDVALAGRRDLVRATGPLPAAHREIRADDGNPLVSVPRGRARLRQFLEWMGFGPIADIWQLPPPPFEPM